MPSSGGSGHHWVGSFSKLLGLVLVSVFALCFIKAIFIETIVLFEQQLSAMDASARTTMKGAAKCDKRCELQNSVNQQGFERILCFRDIPESIPVSVSMPFIPRRMALSRVYACVGFCESGCLILTHAVHLSRSRYRPISKAHSVHIYCVSGARAHILARSSISCLRHEVRSANPPNLSI